MRTVLLYGELRRRFGKYHRFAVKTPAEAIRALCANYKGFEQAAAPGRFHLIVGSGERGLKDVHEPAGERETIRLVPAIAGGKSPFVQILVGAVLIAGAIAFAGPLGAFALPIGMMGGAMLLGGVSQLLATPPKQEEYKQSDNRESYIFNGPTNTSVQGASVPVIYGRVLAGSKVISAGIETHEIA
jgi:predicted phage tail protein